MEIAHNPYLFIGLGVAVGLVLAVMAAKIAMTVWDNAHRKD
jgi:hypothetical protein